MNIVSCDILINPLRIHKNEGASEYLVRVISHVCGDSPNLFVITPTDAVDVPFASTIFQFNPLGGIGIAFLEVNISYWKSVFKLIKETMVKCNNTILFHNFHFGSIGSIILSKILKTRLVYIAHDVEVDRYAQDSISIEEQKVVSVLKILTKVYEFFATRADRIISISHSDKRRLSELYGLPLEKITVISPKISDSRISPKNEKRIMTKRSDIAVVFHGSYKYLPNKEAMEIIRGGISKNISYENVQFLVFGSGSPKVHEGKFRSLGFVDNIYELLSSCDIAIVPLKRGAGVKLKMLDYMAAGLPIVTTKKGTEGLDLVNGKHAIIVDDVDEGFVKAIEYLIENPKIRRKLGHNARNLANMKYFEGEQ
ncbi:glycosyltransferase [Thermococcus radiotolerans]|uniref:Glycosyltransferase subfamily 4-like N-terminal domain-containing protein n=1 Tax=Thermococcus radiotolerans TaxID=187880 RepID=A0A2Z2N757_9EURY|nr:glycosyltransferase [Thermococcus radiotolerans]ASJ15372.1 hypothetical protein A3L10_09610 [Thermococcus radiotolerans]